MDTPLVPLGDLERRRDEKQAAWDELRSKADALEDELDEINGELYRRVHRFPETEGDARHREVMRAMLGPIEKALCAPTLEGRIQFAGLEAWLPGEPVKP